MTKRILIVDDDEAIREVTRVTLEVTAAWTALTASSGAEGVRVAEAEQPDAILLDVMMPDMDGPATIEKLRTNPATRSIPVLFLTAKTQQAHLRQLANLAIQGVIPKPFNPLDLAMKIRALLGWSE